MVIFVTVKLDLSCDDDFILSQVIEQDGVLILETVETDPNDPEALPQVCISSFLHLSS